MNQVNGYDPENKNTERVYGYDPESDEKERIAKENRTGMLRKTEDFTTGKTECTDMLRKKDQLTGYPPE